MKGDQITFFMQPRRRFDDKLLAERLAHTAKRLGLHGAMTVSASGGFGRHQRSHSKHFLELADQPQEVVRAVTAAEAMRLLAHQEALKIQIFCMKTPAELGVSGEATDDS